MDLFLDPLEVDDVRVRGDANRYDEDGDGTVDQYECGEVDGPNYMFWGSEGLTTDFVISEDQAWVLRRHPLFYPLEPQ